MNLGIFDLLVFGLFALMVAAMGLFAIVHFELGPASRLKGSRRWILAAALGSGVLAFAFKLLTIIAVAEFPQFVIDPFIDRFEGPSRLVAAAHSPMPPRYVVVPLPDSDSPAPSSGSDPTERYDWQALPERAPAPPHNPTTPEKVALGERLFFDPALSRDGTLSCASCHDLYGKAGGDGYPASVGIDGQKGSRNAPTVWNTAFQSLLFWDGRAASLEEQAKGPMVNPLEMGMPSLATVEARVREDGTYAAAFAQAFGSGTPITIDRIAEAIAAFERTLITPDTPYDRFVRGDLDALSPAQLRGMALFQSLGCVNCHFGPNFSAASVFDTRAPRRIFPANVTPLESQYELTSDTGAAAPGTGRGVWRVPSLRNVALTGPWLHNGSITDLAEMVRIMAGAQLGRAGHYLVWSDQDKALTEFNRPTLSEQEVRDIVAFLNALSSDTLVARIGPLATTGAVN